MTRGFCVVVASCVLLSACDYRGPLAPPSPAPVAPTISSLTASVDRAHVQWPVGSVVLSVHVTADGSTDGIPLDVELKMDGVKAEMLSRVVLEANGRASATYNFSSPGSITVKTGVLSQTITITQDAAPPPPPPPPTTCNPCAPVPTPPAPPAPDPPTLGVTLSASSTTSDIFTAVTFTATAGALNGAAPITGYAWDFDGDGVTNQTTTTNSASFAYSSVGAKAATVTVTNGTLTRTSQPVTISVTAPALLVSLGSNVSNAPIGGNVTFTATVSSTGPVPSSMNFEWSDDGSGDDVFESVDTGVPTPQSRTVTFGSVGTKTVRIRVTDPATGRTATTTRTVTIQ